MGGGFLRLAAARLLAGAAMAAALAAAAPTAAAQGCITSRGTSCGAMPMEDAPEGHAPGDSAPGDLKPGDSGALDPVYLPHGRFEMSLDWKSSRADENWTGTKHDLDRERQHNNVINIQEVFDLRFSMGITDRWSAGLSLPWIRGSWSLPLPQVPAGQRFEQDSSGFGDLVVGARTWLIDPASMPRGNLQLGLGLKSPTGDCGAKDRFPDASGGNFAEKPVDVSIQPGDGGWGAVLDLNAFRDAGPVRFFAQASYTVNPREANGTLSTPSVLLGPANVAPRMRRNSVPDLYNAQVGAAVSLGGGVGASVALRCEGVPARDRIGGNDGFRRPGYFVAVAPGLSWTRGPATLFLGLPVTILRNSQADASGARSSASFADWAVVAGVTLRF
jgi:hypothetical protein